MLCNLNLNCKLEIIQLTSCLHMCELNAQCLVSSSYAIRLAIITSQKEFRAEAKQKWVNPSVKASVKELQSRQKRKNMVLWQTS